MPGLQLHDVITREDCKSYIRPVDFLKLFFTFNIVSHLCVHTNSFAHKHGPKHPTVFSGWYDLTPEEFYRFCGLLMYAGLIDPPNANLIWSKKSMWNELWAHAFMFRNRLMSKS